MEHLTEPPVLGGARRRRRQRRNSVALVSLAVALVVGGLVLSCPEEERVAAPAASITTPVTERPARAVAAAPPARPAALTIPAIDVRTDLIALGVEKDLTVEVPADADQAGWYELGTTPGQPGSAVILGHVDSTEGPAVFYRLRELDPGARVDVTLADGTIETFEVTRIDTVENGDFPAEKIYAGTPKRPTLAIVTCGGDYDADNGGYQSNVIAYTEHISSAPAV